MKIVGVGCGPGMLTETAIGVISGADLIYGSKRAIDTVRPYIRDGCNVQEIRDYRDLGTLPVNAVLLSTGDPMLAGLGYLPGEVIPGISSLQVAAARLHLSLAKVSVVLAHGRDHTHATEKTLLELSRGKIVFLVPDPKFSVPELAKALVPGHREITMVVLENLGYPEENILMGTPDNPPRPASELFSLVIGDL
jgi:cobalt-precorrin-7 (C5)-methyltransferase